MNRFKRVLKYFLNDVAGLFPYFLAFYIVSFILSLFFESWSQFLNWKAFHISMVVLVIISLFSDRVYKKIISPNGVSEALKIKNIFKGWKSPRQQKVNAAVTYKTSRFFYYLSTPFRAFSSALYKIMFTIRVVLRILFNLVKSLCAYYLIIIKVRTKKLHKTDYLKIAIVAALLIYIFWSKFEILNSIILLYALISILFIVDHRLSFGVALILSLVGAIVFLLKRQVLAELLLLYVFYFLVIGVITQIRAYFVDYRKN